jgi:hypothetical protein
VHPSLPQHDSVGPLARAIEAICLAVAGGLLVANVIRLFNAGNLFHVWIPFAVAAGAIGADCVSGIVHWTADTWGRETLPLIGRRFLRPFRVHHINPEDFVRRDVIDCNGDVAMLTIPILAVALFIPLAPAWGRVAAVAVLAFAAAALPTNQVHQWAHVPKPPRVVRWLQRKGLILRPAAHARHHASPYVMNYCIATGWSNRALTRADFFPSLERLITALTGLRPRHDDEAFAARLDAQSSSAGAASQSEGVCIRRR